MINYKSQAVIALAFFIMCMSQTITKIFQSHCIVVKCKNSIKSVIICATKRYMTITCD